MATNVLSPRTSGGGDSSSPQSRRSRAPWTQVVKGIESEPSVSVSDWPTAEDDSAADDNSDNGNAAVKQAWGKPSNVNGNGDDDAAVMDAASWPALPSQKSASSDSLKALTDGSLPPSQGSGVASLSSNKHVIATTPNLNSTPNHVTNTRQRSMKRGSTNGPSPPQPQGVTVEMSAGKLGTGESSSHKEGGQKGGFGNDNQPQRSNSFNRRGGGGGGQHPRGDGSYHHGYGGRRDQDSGNQEFNSPHRSFSSRDTYMQPQRGAPRGYPRAPHASPPPFISPQLPGPLRPYAGHMVYPTEGPPPFVVLPGPPESIRAMPIMYYPIMDHQLHIKIVNQIDYYFSNENLVKDTFLRQNMDEQGWVPIKLIAGFKKVSNLTDDIQLILHAVYSSTVVEVQNDKIRKRNEWMKWIMPPGSYSPVSSPQARAKSGRDMLVGQLQGVTLDGHSEMFTRSSFGEYTSQLQQSGGEGAVQSGFEHKTPAGSPRQ